MTKDDTTGPLPPTAAAERAAAEASHQDLLRDIEDLRGELGRLRAIRWDGRRS